MLGKILVWLLIVGVVALCVQVLYNSLLAANIAILYPIGYLPILAVTVSADTLRRVGTK